MTSCTDKILTPITVISDVDKVGEGKYQSKNKRKITKI